MTAQKDKPPEGREGRSGDIEARQADDGSFELVMDSTGSSSSPDASDASKESSVARGGARPAKRSNVGAKRLGTAAVVVLATVGVLVYVFAGDSEVVSADDGAEIEAGFRPYLGGPSGENSAPTASSQPSSEDEKPEEDFEDQAPAVSADEGLVDEAEAWEPEEEGEVVVIEERHPPEELDKAEESEQVDGPVEGDDVEPRFEKPTIDPSTIQQFQKRIELPIKQPQLQHIPTPKLNELQPRLPQSRDQPAGGVGDYGDGSPGGQLDQEYGDQDDGFDEYDEGY